MNLDLLTAISPIDGRYRSKTDALAAYFSGREHDSPRIHRGRQGQDRGEPQWIYRRRRGTPH